MTNEEHERVEELLAGYALRSLSGADAEEADALLSNHVPRCASCRETLTGFLTVAGDLALATKPVEPPELVHRRLVKGLDHRTSKVPAHRNLAVALSAAAMIAVFALATWSVVLNGRIAAGELHAANLQRMIDSVPAGSKMVNLGGSGMQLWAAYTPGQASMRLVGINVPAPADGDVYRVWIVSRGRPMYVGQFVPHGADGAVQVNVPVTVPSVTNVFVTEESTSARPGTPSLDGLKGSSPL